MQQICKHIILHLTTVVLLLHTLTPHEHSKDTSNTQLHCATDCRTAGSLFSHWLHHIDEHHAAGQLEYAFPSDLKHIQGLGLVPPHIAIGIANTRQTNCLNGYITTEIQTETVLHIDGRAPPAWT